MRFWLKHNSQMEVCMNAGWFRRHVITDEWRQHWNRKVSWRDVWNFIPALLLGIMITYALGNGYHGAVGAGIAILAYQVTELDRRAKALEKQMRDSTNVRP